MSGTKIDRGVEIYATETKLITKSMNPKVWNRKES
jgi:hypothetical protein